METAGAGDHVEQVAMLAGREIGLIPASLMFDLRPDPHDPWV
jgi:hypothetical protein